MWMQEDNGEVGTPQLSDKMHSSSLPRSHRGGTISSTWSESAPPPLLPSSAVTQLILRPHSTSGCATSPYYLSNWWLGHHAMPAHTCAALWLWHNRRPFNPQYRFWTNKKIINLVCVWMLYNKREEGKRYHFPNNDCIRMLILDWLTVDTHPTHLPKPGWYWLFSKHSAWYWYWQRLL